MKYNMDCNKYNLRTMELLRQIIGLNEKFLSNLEDWEAYDVYLTKRDEIFQELTELNSPWDEDAIQSCPDSQMEEAIHMVHLILALDHDIKSAINKKRLETLESMKNNTIEKKITDYLYTGPIQEGGKVLDFKK